MFKYYKWKVQKNQKKLQIQICVGFAKKILLHFIVCHAGVKFYVIIVQRKFQQEVNAKNVMNIFAKLLELLNNLFND